MSLDATMDNALILDFAVTENIIVGTDPMSLTAVRAVTFYDVAEICVG